MKRVYLSASPGVRQWCSPEIIGGIEITVTDGTTERDIVSLMPGAPDLVAAPTGRKYKNLPWWEVVAVEPEHPEE